MRSFKKLAQAHIAVLCIAAVILALILLSIGASLLLFWILSNRTAIMPFLPVLIPAGATFCTVVFFGLARLSDIAEKNMKG